MEINKMEILKCKNRIQAETDIEVIRRLAITLFDTLKTIHSTKTLDNYTVDIRPEYAYVEKGKWDNIETGSKDYCIGFAKALCEHGKWKENEICVRCGEFEVWPEWGNNL